MRVTADPEVCVGAGQCVLTAGEVFDQDLDGLVRVRLAELPDGRHDDAREAAALCPSGAIRLFPPPADSPATDGNGR